MDPPSLTLVAEWAWNLHDKPIPVGRLTARVEPNMSRLIALASR